VDTTSNEALDRTFKALSDQTRRRIWFLLGERPGASTSDLTSAFPLLSRWAVMKHLDVLRQAELVQTMPEGRQRHHFRAERGL
jgi:DNA-binding transcriptional ArsR family regulator